MCRNTNQQVKPLIPDFASALTHTIGEAEWIEANKQLLKELGPDAYLRRLLDVLKGEKPGTVRDEA